MRGLASVVGVLLLLLTPSLFAQTDEFHPAVGVDAPLIEFPFNGSTDYPSGFSMRQSLAVSNAFYQGFHYALIGDTSLPENRNRIWWVGIFDFVSFPTPFGNGWMHEEWHRAVMTRRGIGSYNDIYTLPFGKNLVAVSHVDDADLVRLKRDHPAEQVRLSSAGMESQVQQNLAIEKSHFFSGARSFDTILLWANAINVSMYLSSCASSDADRSTDEQNDDDGADVAKRDFTGLDCTAWVYDLFRPDEPYAARGTHPSGVGLDRYIRNSDLNQKERDFLTQQKNLSFLNFIDPFLIGFKGFDAEVGGRKVRWNFKFAHYLTSFGATVDMLLFLKLEEEKYLLTLHNGMTDTRYFPGISLESIDRALPWDRFFLTSGITVWQQPRGQRVETTAAETTVDASAQVSYELNPRFSPYFGVEGKTPGWIAGNVYLDRNVSAWTGFRAKF